MKTKLFPFAILALLVAAPFARADDAELVVRNNSSETVRLYSNEDDEWEYEKTIRPFSGTYRFEGDPGDVWGFTDPFSSRPTIIKSVTLRGWGLNSLTLTDADLEPDPGPIPPPAIPRTMTVFNKSSFDVSIYANHGQDWHREDVIPAGGSRRFVVQAGEGWGIDDPTRRGINLVRSFTINPLNLIPAYTITDRDFGIEPEPPGRDIIAINNSRESVRLYLDEGDGFRLEGTLRPGTRRTYSSRLGDQWAFDDPFSSGFNEVKSMTVRAWGISTFTINDSELGGSAGPLPLPLPLPIPRPGDEVQITFKNQSMHKVEVFKKRGPFGKVYLNTIGPWGSKAFDLTPGDAILLSRPNRPESIFYRVPGRDAFYPFKPPK